MFPYDASILEPLCDELDGWRSRLDFRGPLARRWAGRLRRELEAEAVAASTSMEGVPVTVDEVRRILAGDKPAEVAPEDRELVEGYRAAMGFVLRRADDPAFRWTREAVVGVHDRILAARYDEGAGRLRVDRPAFVVNRKTGEQVFTPPPGEDVGGHVDAICERMDQGHPHPAIAGAWIHVALAAVHPFRDGNGRVSRICASLAMLRGGFKRAEFTSLEEWWGRHLDTYYAAFTCLGSGFDEDVDVTPFLHAHLSAQVSQVLALDGREKVEGQIWTVLETHAEDVGSDRRLANALWDAFFGRSVTAGYYRSLADVSPATATKDLATLVAAGLLRAEGSRRGRRYVSTDVLFRVVGGALGINTEGGEDVARVTIVAELARRVAMT